MRQPRDLKYSLKTEENQYRFMMKLVRTEACIKYLKTGLNVINTTMYMQSQAVK